MKNKLYPVVVFFVGLVFVAGCSSTSEVLDEPQAQQASAPEENIANEPAQAEPAPEVTLKTTFYFDFDDATIQPDARLAIEAHAQRLKNNSQTIRIEGYADERGTEEYNKQLGQRRADAVRDLLVSMGVSYSQIQTVSYGESKPFILGSNEQAWQKNRRVELK